MLPLLSSSCMNMYYGFVFFFEAMLLFLGQEMKTQLKFIELEFICVRVKILHNLESGFTTA